MYKDVDEEKLFDNLKYFLERIMPACNEYDIRMVIHPDDPAYPNFKVVAITLRKVYTATVNDWSALCYADGQIFMSDEYKGLEIMDRVGGGDSFASGLIYGLMTCQDPQKAVNYGAAHGALAMTTPGDTTMASVKEVEAVMSGAGARVQR